MNALYIDHLCKHFGNTEILNQLCLTVPEHSIFGFLGENGAGKTTTMKLSLGLLKADGGLIELFGSPVRFGQTDTNRAVGYLPDVPEFYPYMTPNEYLSLCGSITGMPASAVKRRSSELLSLVGLEASKKRIGGFSRGMKQRLGIAQALLHEPKLLICDEPTSALDPVGRKEILDILCRLKGKTTVLFSTHILSDAENICDQIAILHGGHIALEGRLDELKKHSAHNQIDIGMGSREELLRLMESAPMKPFYTALPQEGNSIALHTDNTEETAKNIFAAFHMTGLIPARYEIARPSLERLFLDTVSAAQTAGDRCGAK